MSVNPANVNPIPTNPLSSSQYALTKTPRMTPAKTNRPAPRRTCLSSDHLVFTLATTGRPAFLHAAVPPSKHCNVLPAWLEHARSQPRPHATLADQQYLADGLQIRQPTLDLLQRDIHGAWDVPGRVLRAVRTSTN